MAKINEKIKHKINSEKNKIKELDEFKNNDNIEFTDEINDELDNLYKFNDDFLEQSKKIVDDRFMGIDLNFSDKSFLETLKLARKNKLIEKNMEGALLKHKDKISKVSFELRQKLSVVYEFQVVQTYWNLFDAWRSDQIEEFIKKMKMIAEMTEGVRAIGDTFGRFWDLTIGTLRKMDMSQIKKFQEIFRNKDFIKRIAELLGRLACTQKEYEEFVVKDIKYKFSRKRFYNSPENTVGVTQGSHIPIVLPHQLAYRGKPGLDLIFKKNFIEKKLMQLDQKAKMLDEVETTRTERRFKQDNKGPFILVIDTSGSMHGEPESIAKAMALAITKIAKVEKRKCYIINFSTQIVEFDASDLNQSFDKLVNFLSKSFSGGTDIQPALDAALKKLNDNDYSNADVILISDLIINSLGQNLEQRIKEAKKKKVRFHSLSIGRSQIVANTDFLDNNWIYDGSDKSIEKIILDLNTMNKGLEERNIIKENYKGGEYEQK